MRVATGQIWQSLDGHNRFELVIVHDIDDTHVHVRGGRASRVRFDRFMNKYALVAEREPIR